MDKSIEKAKNYVSCPFPETKLLTNSNLFLNVSTASSEQLLRMSMIFKASLKEHLLLPNTSSKMSRSLWASSGQEAINGSPNK